MQERIMDQRIINLYDSFTHGGISRRDFLDRLTALAGGTAAASALLASLQNNYAHAQMIAENDPRLKSEMIMLGALNGYLVRPADTVKRPAVLVIHENRGLNPHIRDVVRRVALAGFIAYGADYLTPLGGTLADEDKSRDLFPQLKPDDVAANSRAVVAALRARPDGNGRVGAVGFCWGGGQVGALAATDPTLDAGVVYYGVQPKAELVPAIKAPLLLNYAGMDERINAGIPAFEKALKDNGKTFTLHIYEGKQHAFNNDTNAARYDKETAELAWSRTIAFFKKYLGD
ncbi:MAG: dienelactone hydrolase family protein, partial [Beijerinckiaceae bacterium]